MEFRKAVQTTPPEAIKLPQINNLPILKGVGYYGLKHMDAEHKSIRQLDENKKAILEAQTLMDHMAALRARIHIRDGCGQRYLQKIKPSQTALQQAEKEIVNQYAGTLKSSSAKTSKKSNLLKTMARRGMT